MGGIIIEIKDYYYILDISQESDETEIKDAHRKLAKKWHPDVCKEDNSHERFVEIQEAYEILINPRTRKEYDYMFSRQNNAHENFKSNDETRYSSQDAQYEDEYDEEYDDGYDDGYDEEYYYYYNSYQTSQKEARKRSEEYAKYSFYDFLIKVLKVTINIGSTAGQFVSEVLDGILDGILRESEHTHNKSEHKSEDYSFVCTLDMGNNIVGRVNHRSLSIIGTGQLNKDNVNKLFLKLGKHSKFDEVTIEEGITSIGDHAFKNRPISSIKLPDTVVNIGRDAFSNCNNLRSIKLSNSLKSIENSAFSGCNSLRSFEMPDSVTKIGKYAFYGCGGLVSLRLSYSLTSIEDYSFSHCSSLRVTNFPLSIVNIGQFAFWNCSSLISVKLPKNVLSIGDNAFFGCSNLKSIQIPKSAKRGKDIIRACEKLPFKTKLDNRYRRLLQAFKSNEDILVESEEVAFNGDTSNSEIDLDSTIKNNSNNLGGLESDEFSSQEYKNPNKTLSSKRKGIVYLGIIALLLTIVVFISTQGKQLNKDEKAEPTTEIAIDTSVNQEATELEIAETEVPEKVELTEEETARNKEIIEEYRGLILHDGASPRELSDFIKLNSDVLLTRYTENELHDSFLREMNYWRTDYETTVEESEDIWDYADYFDELSGIDDSNVRQFFTELKNNGFEINSGEGGYGVGINNGFILDTFIDVFSNANKSYYELLNTKPDYSDGYTESSFDDIAEYLIKIESYIDEYPNSKYAISFKGSYQWWLEKYFLGMINSPVYDINRENLKYLDEVITSYNTTISKYSNTVTSVFTTSFLKLLDLENYIYNDTVYYKGIEIVNDLSDTKFGITPMEEYLNYYAYTWDEVIDTNGDKYLVYLVSDNAYFNEEYTYDSVYNFIGSLSMYSGNFKILYVREGTDDYKSLPLESDSYGTSDEQTIFLESKMGVYVTKNSKYSGPDIFTIFEGQSRTSPIHRHYYINNGEMYYIGESFSVDGPLVNFGNDLFRMYSYNRSDDNDVVSTYNIQDKTLNTDTHELFEYEDYEISLEDIDKYR